MKQTFLVEIRKSYRIEVEDEESPLDKVYNMQTTEIYRQGKLVEVEVTHIEWKDDGGP